MLAHSVSGCFVNFSAGHFTLLSNSNYSLHKRQPHHTTHRSDLQEAETEISEMPTTVISVVR
jgi:hypothetical protein